MKHVFVSSTFKDMQFERDALRTVAAVNINEKLSAYGEEVYFGDLRWGVNTTSLDSEEGCRRVLEVCLDEIDDCRPHMIVLIGERYGWIPEGGVIREAAAAKGIEVGDEISVTQLEIEYGALARECGAGGVFFYFRELDTTGMSAEQLADYTAESELHRSRIEALKHRLTLLYPDSVRTYTARFDKESQRVVGLEGFLETVCADLSHTFLDELLEEESLPWQERAMRSAHRHYLEFSENYYDAERVPLTLFDGTFSAKRTVMRLIKGDHGTGKSSYLAYSYKMAAEDFGEGALLPFVLGLDKYSTCEADYFKLLLYKLEELAGEEHIQTEYGVSECDRRVFARIMQLEKRIGCTLGSFIDNCSYELQNSLSVNLLDGHFALGDVEYFGRSECETEHLEFLIAYSASEPQLILPPAFDFSRTYVCGDVSEEDQVPLVKMLLRRKHKELDGSVIAAIAEKEQARSPFYLKLAVDRMLMLDNRDFAEIRAMGDGMDNINRYQISVVRSLPDTVPALASELARRVAGRVGEEFTMRLLGILVYGASRMSEGFIEGVFLTRSWAFSSLDFALATRSLSALISYNPKDKSYMISDSEVISALLELLDEGGFAYVARSLAEYAAKVPEARDIFFRATAYTGAEELSALYAAARDDKSYLMRGSDWLIVNIGAEFAAEVLMRAAKACPDHDFSYIVSAIPTSCMTVFDSEVYIAFLQTIIDNIKIKNKFPCSVYENSLAAIAWVGLVNIRMKVNTSDAAPIFHAFIDAGHRTAPMMPRARIAIDVVYYRFLALEAFHSMKIIYEPEPEPASAYLLSEIGDAEQNLLLSSHLFGSFAAYLHRAFEDSYAEFADLAKRGYKLLGESLAAGELRDITADDVATMIDCFLEDRDDMLRADVDSVGAALELMAAGQKHVDPRLLKYLPRILYAAKYSFDDDGADFSEQTVNMLRRLCATSRAVAGSCITTDDVLYATVQMEQSYDILCERIDRDEHLTFITHFDKFVRILLSTAGEDPRVFYRCYLSLRKLLDIFELYDLDRQRLSMLDTVRALEVEDPDAPILPELFIGSLIYRYADPDNGELRDRLRSLFDTVSEADEYSSYASAYSPELLFLGIDLKTDEERAADMARVNFHYDDEDADEYSLDEDDDDFSLDDDDFSLDDEDYDFDDVEYDIDIEDGEFDLDLDIDDGDEDGELGEDEFSADEIKDMLDFLKKSGLSLDDLLGDGEDAD